MKKLLLFSAVLLMLQQTSLAQSNSVSIGTTTVKDKAILWLKNSGGQGLILPSVSTTERNSMALNNSDEKGMIVYDNILNQIFYWNGIDWLSVSGGGTTGGSATGIQINGNTIQLGGTGSASISAIAPNGVAGQLLMWNGTTWVVTSSSGAAPALNQVLTWNGTNWAPQSLGTGGTVTNVTGTAPISVATGTLTPVISMAQATATTDGYLGKTDFSTFSGKVSLGGDLGGTATAPLVSKIQGVGISSSAPTASQVLQYNGTSWAPATLAIPSGTVTSVGLSLPSIFSVTGSPITGTGTLTGTLASQTANTIFAAPNGSAGAPSFRAMVAADLPNMDVSKLTTGTLGVTRGGTGLGTAPTNGQLLIGNGTGYTLASLTAGTGIGVTNGAGTISIATSGNFGAQNLTTTGTLTAGGTTVTGLTVSGTTSLNTVSYTWPNTQGAAASVLTNNGSGTLSWAPIPAPFSTANILPKGNGTGLTASQLFDNGTFVGIGTTSPLGRLHVENADYGSSPLYLTSTASSAGSTIRFTNPDANNHTYDIIGSTGSGSFPGAGSFGIWDETSSAYRMVIGPTGDTGIGTYSPASKLHVAGDLRTDGYVLSGIAPFSNSWYRAAFYQPNAGNGSALYLLTADAGNQPTDGAQISLASGTNPNIEIANREAGGINFYTNGYVQRMTLTTSGNLGVGSTAAVNKLDVEGGAVIGASYSGSSVAPTNGLLVQGNMGIGTTSPASQLHLIQTNGINSNGLTIQNTNSNTWSLYTASTSDFWLVGGGVQKGGFNFTSGAYTATSDRNRKKNFEDLGNILPEILKLKPMRYHFKEQKDGDQKFLGFIAQDVKELFPSLVNYSEENNLHTLDYAGFGTLAIKAIQEQQEIINQQQSEIDKLKSEIEEIKRLLKKN